MAWATSEALFVAPPDYHMGNAFRVLTSTSPRNDVDRRLLGHGHRSGDRFDVADAACQPRRKPCTRFERADQTGVGAPEYSSSARMW